MPWAKRSVSVRYVKMSVSDRQVSNSFLTATRQTWKVYAFFVLLLASGVSFVLMVLALSQGDASTWPLDDVSLAVVAGITGVGAVVWLTVSLRCPTCRARVAAHVITCEALSEWLPKLIGLSQCPRCGSRGGEESGRTT